MIEHTFSTLPLLQHYGSLAIFILLALGIIALPIPEEPLLILLGILMAKGQIALLPSILAALCGAGVGITVSYGLGSSVGHYAVQRWGKYLGLTEPRLQFAHHWFERIGKWMLIIAYFIPGLRHLSGYIAGTVQLPYRIFALFAYAGAVIWVSLFLSLGYFLHGHWHDIKDSVHWLHWLVDN